MILFLRGPEEGRPFAGVNPSKPIGGHLRSEMGDEGPVPDFVSRSFSSLLLAREDIVARFLLASILVNVEAQNTSSTLPIGECVSKMNPLLRCVQVWVVICE